MNKKVVVLGGGTGMSVLLRGLKKFPLDITAIVSVCDDGKSTGILREEFKTPAVGDIRKVLIALSETEPPLETLLSYRFDKNSSLKGHAIGNLLLTAAKNITGNLSDGIEILSKVLNLRGKVVPLTEDNVVLIGKMEDGSFVEGEHNITEDKRNIESVSYKDEPVVNPSAIQAIKEADLIILSMGSVFTSVIPNLICKEVIDTIDNSKAKIMYVCNMMTQPGETDNFNVSHHIKLLNKYLGNRKIDQVVVNNGKISSDSLKIYETLEQKDQVVFDREAVQEMNVQIIESDFVIIEDNIIRHNVVKLASYIFSSLI